MSAPGVVDEDLGEVLSAVEKLGAAFVSSTNVPLSRVIRAVGGSASNTSWCSNSSLGIHPYYSFPCITYLYY